MAALAAAAAPPAAAAGVGASFVSLSDDELELVIDVRGIDASLANALRRICLAEVPTVAIERVWINLNTCVTAPLLLRVLLLSPTTPVPLYYKRHYYYYSSHSYSHYQPTHTPAPRLAPLSL